MRDHHHVSEDSSTNYITQNCVEIFTIHRQYVQAQSVVGTGCHTRSNNMLVRQTYVVAALRSAWRSDKSTGMAISVNICIAAMHSESHTYHTHRHSAYSISQRIISHCLHPVHLEDACI